ncbi:hypothetical protein [Lysobacter capsici]|uniref:hypothetical protein n=1 Tax=Lysobacter capsici TaxID=435897 RepID=UPI001BFFF97C|nr:hypothetical protein [Lysobacter capsici]QWF16533.1 hypothetical protein KME82_22735 [Lysobacter capsici]
MSGIRIGAAAIVAARCVPARDMPHASLRKTGRAVAQALIHPRKRMGERVRQLVMSGTVDSRCDDPSAVAAAACIGVAVGRCDIDHESGFVIALSKNTMLL